MTAFESREFACNGQIIHAKLAGPEDAPVMVMLHGFPEYWIAWAEVAENLAGSYRTVLPDQRGFHRSSKPAGAEAYLTKHMVADLKALVDEVSPDRPIILCGHDWGASVAYAFAMRNPDRVSHLVIANGVHPICFQKALFAGGEQTAASQYMNLLKAPDSETRLMRENYKPLLNMFSKFSEAPWLTDEKQEQYIASWSRPDALTNMLNWYRSSPMVVPEEGAEPQTLDITEDMITKYHIPMPHLLIWGLQDTALLPEAREDLHRFCDDLVIKEVENASHWILHEQPLAVADTIRSFLTR